MSKFTMHSYTEPTYDPSDFTVGQRYDWLADQLIITRIVSLLGDTVAIVMSALAGRVIVTGALDTSLPDRTAILLAILLTWIVFNAGGLYTSWRGRGYVDQVRSISLCWFTVVFFLIISGYLIGESTLYDRSWVIVWALVGYLSIVAIRISVIVALRAAWKRGLNHKRVLVIGGGNWGRQVIGRLCSAEWLGLDVVGVLDHNSELHGSQIEGVPVLGGYDRLLDIVGECSVDEVWICLPLGSHRTEGSNHIGYIVEMLEESIITQRLLPEFEEMRVLNRPITEIMGLPVVNLNTSPMHGVNRLVKGLEDRVLALFILLLVGPLMLVIAIAIKWDSEGPVFFRQMRHGWDGKPFAVLKFRSMKRHIEKPGTLTQATKNDSRVTGIGAFLRRTSLDELPQFLNVLQGKMSIVGPRPHPVELNDYYKKLIRSYMQRHRVKPGITGWAQINGFRGETADIEKMRQRVSLDHYYIEHWSLSFDIKIILRTMVSGFRQTNAY